MRPENGATREQGGSHESKHNAESNRVTHSVAGDRTTIDGDSRSITWTEEDAARVLAFIAECAKKERTP